MKAEKIINGIQQIGIGVKDAKQVFNWYRKNFGFDILVFEDVATADLMAQYTDGVAHQRYAMLALNMIGGGGLEIWQYTSRVPRPSSTPFLLGDLGINVMKIRSGNIKNQFTALEMLSLKPMSLGDHDTHFFFSDPWNNLVEVVQNDYCFSKTKYHSGGVLGAIIGISDMKAALLFYQNLLGYHTLVSDRSGIFEEFSQLPGGQNRFRRVLLKHEKKQVGGFGELYGPSEIELIQVLDRKPIKIFKGRLWGDLGYIHLCFDIYGMDPMRNNAKTMGYKFTVDSTDSFDMGNAAGRFGYVEDPDGTLIEFVETHRVPIVKRLGIHINLSKRNPHKPLPRWLVKALRVHRIHKEL